LAEGSSPSAESPRTTTYDGLDRVLATEIGTTFSQRTEYTLDIGGRAIEIDDGFTCATSTYDYRDLVLTTVDSLDTSTCASNASSRTITITYDALGRLTQAEVTDGPDDGDRPSIATYDAVGNVLTAAALVGGTTETTTFIRNKVDQVVAEARADGSDAKTTFDSVGHLSADERRPDEGTSDPVWVRREAPPDVYRPPTMHCLERPCLQFDCCHRLGDL
jgi:hypothetical protein